jgi:hypothetical protein
LFSLSFLICDLLVFDNKTPVRLFSIHLLGTRVRVEPLSTTHVPISLAYQLSFSLISLFLLSRMTSQLCSLHLCDNANANRRAVVRFVFWLNDDIPSYV